MKFGIGTVQFGMKYGITNHTDKTSFAEAKKIIELAQKNRIEIIDTAVSYGNSETTLGKILTTPNPFKIITKIPTLINQKNSPNIIKKYLFQSLKKLNQESLYGLLLHNAGDLLSANGNEYFNVLSNLKEKGYIHKIGISVYEQCEIEDVLEKFKIDIVQIPINIFDQRLIQNGYLKVLHKLGIEIHARSIFLKGLLLENPNYLSSFFDPIKDDLMIFQNEMKKQNISLAEAALNFVTNVDEIDYSIVGVNNTIQLEEILFSINNNLRKYDFSDFAINNEKYLNPANWKIH